MLITVYSIIHTVGHLTGSVRALDHEDDIDEINRVLTHKRFDAHKSYAEILFKTVPGVTGILLLVIICTMCITSTEKARRKSFQLFATVHVI